MEHAPSHGGDGDRPRASLVIFCNRSNPDMGDQRDMML